jgi:transcriptional regulator with XRE-family HTH domain
MRVDSSKTLGELIRNKRKALGMTLQMAAPMCGVSVKYLQALETGKPSVQFDKALQVARHLGIQLIAQE